MRKQKKNLIRLTKIQTVDYGHYALRKLAKQRLFKLLKKMKNFITHNLCFGALAK